MLRRVAVASQREIWTAFWCGAGCGSHRFGHRQGVAATSTGSYACRDVLAQVEERLEFTGEVALVTGGTSGIGATTARRLDDLGAKVVITGRGCREGRMLVNEIHCHGGRAAFLQADLSESDQVRLIVPFTIDTFGRLDYAFNNAGTSGENRLLLEQTEENFDLVFDVNVKALFLLLQAEVNMASVSGTLAIPGAGHYVASKHAVLGLTKTCCSRIWQVWYPCERGESGRRAN